MANIGSINSGTLNSTAIQNYLSELNSKTGTSNTSQNNFFSQSTSDFQSGGVSGSSDLSGTQRHPPFLDAAASALGMSTSDLSSAMQNGESLSDIASSQGVSTDTLTSALVADIQSKHPGTSTADATTMAENVINGTPPSGGPGGPGGGSGNPPYLDTAASALGMSSSDLSSALQSGESLTDVANAQGVSVSDLQSALESDLESKQPDLSTEQVQEMVQHALTATQQSQEATTVSASSLQLNSISV
jgi:tape measure domain-containing protein